ncbi:MAG TPA: thymidine phosphorylase, partial [bacterium]|nr:thymidine phosphorylase [bacterium]
MSPYEIIMKKRNRQELTGDEIRWLIRSYTDGEIPDYQMSAWLMSVFFNGMTFRETTDLTLAMRDSGVVVDLSSIPGIKVDKHSTGGVGDKISLILAPLAASLGVVVPMISGRGLGHTGGTLDKLESITGFDIFFPMEKFIDVLRSIGVCMIGQTAEIAPADK